jgi:hypothetical protein
LDEEQGPIALRLTSDAAVAIEYHVATAGRHHEGWVDNSADLGYVRHEIAHLCVMQAEKFRDRQVFATHLAVPVIGLIDQEQPELQLSTGQIPLPLA